MPQSIPTDFNHRLDYCSSTGGYMVPFDTQRLASIAVSVCPQRGVREAPVIVGGPTEIRTPTTSLTGSRARPLTLQDQLFFGASGRNRTCHIVSARVSPVIASRTRTSQGIVADSLGFEPRSTDLESAMLAVNTTSLQKNPASGCPAAGSHSVNRKRG